MNLETCEPDAFAGDYNILLCIFYKIVELQPRFGREPLHDDDFNPTMGNKPRETHVLRARETRCDSALLSPGGTALGRRMTVAVLAKLVQTHFAT